MANAAIPDRPLRWDERIDAIRAILAPDETVYVVGGSVRDAYLHRPIHDVDLATPGDGRPLARRIANHFDGAYYALDAERGVGRAIIPWENTQLTIDVAQFRGPDLITDLTKRDFTLNAMAVLLTGSMQDVVDPTGGLEDLAAGQLRHCTPDSIPEDPIRALRAIRASVTFKLIIEAETRASIKQHVTALASISPERIRDEFVQILVSNQPAAALTALYHLGLLQQIVPETSAIQNVKQSAPHQFTVWRHTLQTVEQLNLLLATISPQRNHDTTANVRTGAAAFALDIFRTDLQTHIQHTWPNERPHKSLLMLAALLHDAGKAHTQTTDADGRIRFLNHETTGEQIAEQRGQALRLSNGEITRLTTIIRHHMRPHWLNTDALPSRRAIYRFWRDTGTAGVDICLLAMADYLATHGVTLDSHAWTHYLETIQALLSYYFEHSDDNIIPPPLLSGQELIDIFELAPGPQIGDLLAQLQEAQAVGIVTTKKEAQDFVRRSLNSNTPQ